MILHNGVKLATRGSFGEAISHSVRVVDLAIQESNVLASHGFAARFLLGPATPRRVNFVTGPSSAGAWTPSDFEGAVDGTSQPSRNG
jgi:hypothetical protein